MNSRNDEKEKKLKHVRVYDKLYALIQEGEFPPGCQLPSEPDLALRLQVSRMTLRRALALLQEDHLVKNIRGKGNFITNPELPLSSTKMAQLRHPVYGCCTCALDEVELELRIEPPTESISKSLGGRPAAVVITDRWYFHNQKPTAYSLSFIPIEVISNRKIDLNSSDSLRRFLEEELYQTAAVGRSTFSYTTTGNFTAGKYILSENESFILIHEDLFDENHVTLISTKHYIPIELFTLLLEYK